MGGMSQAIPINGSVLPPGDIVEGARSMVRKLGLNQAARLLRVGRQPLATAALVSIGLAAAEPSLNTDPPLSAA